MKKKGNKIDFFFSCARVLYSCIVIIMICLFVAYHIYTEAGLIKILIHSYLGIIALGIITFLFYVIVFIIYVILALLGLMKEKEEITEDFTNENLIKSNLRNRVTIEYSVDYLMFLIDNLTNVRSNVNAGTIFEKIICKILKVHRFNNIRRIGSSGDNGVDILAEFDGELWAIQCKCYQKNVTNKAVQEVYTGKEIYGCQKAIVFTNSYFSDSAIIASDATRVGLWDRNVLIDSLNDLSKSDIKELIDMCIDAPRFSDSDTEKGCFEYDVVVPTTLTRKSRNFGVISDDIFNKYLNDYIDENYEREDKLIKK